MSSEARTPSAASLGHSFPTDDPIVINEVNLESPHTSSPAVRIADEKWGCAFDRCLNKARYIVAGPEGSEWGACREHLKTVKRRANDH